MLGLMTRKIKTTFFDNLTLFLPINHFTSKINFNSSIQSNATSGVWEITKFVSWKFIVSLKFLFNLFNFS